MGILNIRNEQLNAMARLMLEQRRIVLTEVWDKWCNLLHEDFDKWLHTEMNSQAGKQSLCHCKTNRMITRHNGIDYCYSCNKPIK